MTTLRESPRRPHAAFDHLTARELMTPNPVSLRQDATLREAAALLAGRGVSAAPVIDTAGRPVGVISSTDIVCDQAARADTLRPLTQADDRPYAPPAAQADLKAIFRAVLSGTRAVREYMTPAVFCVRPGTPARKVAAKMVKFNVRRLFVVDEGGVLVGVVSSLDLLRAFCREEADG